VIPGKQYKIEDVWAILWRRKWLIGLPALLAIAVTATATRLMPDRFRSETLILVVPQRVPESYVRSTVTTRIEDRLPSISQQILSRPRLERIIGDLDLYAEARRTQLMEDVIKRMRQDIEVELVKGDAFRVSYSGTDRKAVKQVTERLASLFIEENLRDRAVLAEDSYVFLDSQLTEARRKLVEHEKKLEAYRRQYSGQLPSQLEANLHVIQNTQMQIQSINESMARDRDRRLIVERSIADVMAQDAAAEPSRVTVPADGEPGEGTAAQQLEAAREALRQMALRLKPEHPDVIGMKRLIATIEKRAAAEAGESSDPNLSLAEITAENKLTELRAELDSIDRQIARKEQEEAQLREAVKVYQARVEATPTRESDLIELMRDYDTLQKTYTSLLMKKEDSRIAANLERRQIGEQFKILEPARVPEKPIGPHRLRINALGALLGLAVGFALAALLEFGDSTLKTDDDVLSALGLPVLALVPFLRTDAERRRARRRRLAVAIASATVLALVAAAAAFWTIGATGRM
jgi:polysaccharide chain length determinant protein (PEP-CTERM system associated)